MITRSEQAHTQRRAAEMIRRCGVPVTADELARIDVADFGLSDLQRQGVEILTLFQTDRIAGKILVMFPNQTEPEHWHPPVGSDPGKEETVRMIWGDLRFYIDGPDTLREGFIVEGKADCYTCRHEIIMAPGQQLTLRPGQKHWFQGGRRGAVLFSFSTCVRDILDGFTDRRIVRQTVVVEG